MSLADDFVKFALFLVGKNYTWGEEPWFIVGGQATVDPYDTDCSGLIFGVYRKLGVLWKNGATWPRLTANGYKYNAVPITAAEAKAGDVVVFVNSSGVATHIVAVIGKQADGKVHTVEARGHDYGVVNYAIDDPVNGVIKRGGHFMRFPWVNLGVITPPTPVEPPALPDYPTLRRGMYNNKYVKIAQQKLIAHGYSCGPTGADGDFGRNTLIAVEKFQAAHKDSTGKPLEVDGVIGPKTWGALLGVVAPPKPSTNVLTAEQIALVAAKAGFTGENLSIAVAVAMAESGRNALAHGDTQLAPYGSYGLWQINSHAHPDLIGLPADSSKWYDPFVNATFAFKVSSRGTNWNPWSVYIHGTYKTYLPDAKTAVSKYLANPSSIPIPKVITP